MGWQGGMAMTEEVLDRIVVLLLALADLAAEVVTAPHGRRCLALAIIQSGAIYAADAFDPTVEDTDDEAPDVRDIHPCGSPTDALCLATALRVLAFTLHTMVRRHCVSSEASADALGAHGGDRLSPDVCLSLLNGAISARPQVQRLDSS